MKPKGLGIVATEAAPQAIGPYSQAVVVDGTVYTAGQIALAGQCSLDALAFAHHLLGLLLVRPEVRIAGLLFYLGELLS